MNYSKVLSDTLKVNSFGVHTHCFCVPKHVHSVRIWFVKVCKVINLGIIRKRCFWFLSCLWQPCPLFWEFFFYYPSNIFEDILKHPILSIDNVFLWMAPYCQRFKGSMTLVTDGAASFSHKIGSSTLWQDESSKGLCLKLSTPKWLYTSIVRVVWPSLVQSILNAMSNNTCY